MTLAFFNPSSAEARYALTIANSVDQLIWICSVCYYVNLYQQPESSDLIGLQLELEESMAS